MVHLGAVNFDMYSSHSIKDNHFGRRIGVGNEDRGYGRLSRELQNHEASKG
jgi:hypothetical protein